MGKILIVDDSETVRDQLWKKLESAGFDLLEGDDGLAGIRKFEENLDIELIICDVNMPNLDGIGMCQEIAKRFPERKVPIFMLTTEGGKETKARAKDAGVVVWILKPFDEDRVLEAVSKYLNRKTG